MAKRSEYEKLNEKYDQHDDKLKTKDWDVAFGSLDPTSTDDGAGPTGDMTVGTGIPATNFNKSINHEDHIELGLKVHLRTGPDVLPTSVDADGTANYTVPSGDQSAGRAKWNFDSQ